MLRMGVFQDVYMQEGIAMNIQLLKTVIEDAKRDGQTDEYISGLQDALAEIEYQLKTFPWE